jgi:ribosomal protein L29
MEKNQNILQVTLSKKLIWLNNSNSKINDLELTKIKLKSELFDLRNKKINKKEFKGHLIQNKKHQISQLNTFITQNRLTKIYNECLKISDCYITKEIQKKIDILSLKLTLVDKNFNQQKFQKIENIINFFKQNLKTIKLRESKCSQYDGLGYNPQNLKLYYKHSDSNQILHATSLEVLEKRIKKELKKHKYQLFNNFLYDQFIGE